MAFTVLTHNVCSIPGTGLARRVVLMCRTYTRLDPDVLALQEVPNEKTLRLLRELLPSMPYATWVNARRGPMAGLVVFSKKQIQTTDHLLFSKKPWYWGRGYRKGAIAWETEDVQGVNFHFSFNPLARWNTPNPRAMAQAWQVAKLAEFVNAMDSRPTVVVGDANIHYGTLLYWQLVKGTDLLDPFGGRKPTISNDSGSRAYTMDYALMRGFGGRTAEVETAFDDQTGLPPRVRRGDVSDHKMLVLRIT